MQFKADNSREKKVIREGTFLLGGGGDGGGGLFGPGPQRELSYVKF